VTVGPPGGAWGQFPASYHVQSAGALATLVYTISPTLINEFSWGINRGKQGVDPLTDTSSDPNIGGVSTYPQSLLPLKDVNGNPLTLPRINPASNYLHLLPAVNFGLPSAFSAQSSGQGVNGAPTFSLDSRWPFTGTDQLQTIQDKVTWVKGAHTLKAGIYVEKMARNVSVYSVYNAAGTYYFGSDRANPLDTNYPYANAMVGSIFAYGDDSTKLVNHARYTQIEWYLQDTWKVSRRLTLDYGARFYRVGDLNSVGANLGLFNAASYNANQVGQLLYPACSIPSTTATCPAADKIAINPKTGVTFPYVRQGTFDTSSYAASALPYSGIKTYNTHFWNVAPIQVSPCVVGRVWRRQDGHTRRLRHHHGPQLERGLHRRVGCRPGPDDGAANVSGADHRLHELPEPDRIAVGVHATERDRRLADRHAAGDLQLELRYPARVALPHDRGRLLCGQRAKGRLRRNV